MKESEIRTGAKALALRIITGCDEMYTHKGRAVLVNKIIRRMLVKSIHTAKSNG